MKVECVLCKKVGSICDYDTLPTDSHIQWQCKSAAACTIRTTLAQSTMTDVVFLHAIGDMHYYIHKASGRVFKTATPAVWKSYVYVESELQQTSDA
jgi:hypothetical protein